MTYLGSGFEQIPRFSSFEKNLPVTRTRTRDPSVDAKYHYSRMLYQLVASHGKRVSYHWISAWRTPRHAGDDATV